MDATQLAQVEQLANQLYAGGPGIAEAQSRLLSLQQSADNIPTCQYILNNSTNNYALLVASNSLSQLITSHWNNFTVQQRIDLRNYVLTYLAEKGSTIDNFVLTSVIKLVCRITKLGWFDDVTHRELPDQVKRFLEATVDHCVIGLKILNQLVDELNIPTVGRTLTAHRKSAVSFRDTSLKKVFELGLATLDQLKQNAIQGTPRQIQDLGLQSLSLVVRCLGFDFIGTNPDESTEDVGTIQIPMSWRALIMSKANMEVLFDFYKNTEPPRSNKAMEAIILLSSTRRSLFSTDKDRTVFTDRLMAEMAELMRNKTGLHHGENYHEFCRLLGRIKANFQLTEFVKYSGFVEWLRYAADFTVTSIENWQWSKNSIHYLLAMWVRLVSAVPYVRADTGEQGFTKTFEKQVSRVVECYLKSMLASVETVVNDLDGEDDPLDDDGSLKEQLEKLPTLCRFLYEGAGKMILDHFDTIKVRYQQLVNGGSTSPNDIKICEGKLSWLVYIIGSIIGGHSWNQSSFEDGSELIDGQLSRRVFQLSQLTDLRILHTNGQGKCDMKLELAYLYYLDNFRRVYMFCWDSTQTTRSVMGGAEGPSTKAKIYQRMFECMEMGNNTQVTNLIINKVGNNLKFWPNEVEIIGQTLDLFLDMSQGYSSSKLLLTLDSVKFLLNNHNVDHFPFLKNPANIRHRTTFHATLTRLLFTFSSEEMPMTFEKFLEPTLTTLTQLGQLGDNELRSEGAKWPLIGVLRDLRGIASSLHNKRTYLSLFEALHPNHFAVFIRIAELWFDTPEVTTSLLKFLNEFVHNKANRVSFDQSSPNGILLFRNTSSILCGYGQQQLKISGEVIGANEIYKKRYKGFSLMLNTLFSALTGNYVCFGVFSLYNDPALDNSLNTALEVVLSIPIEGMISFPKLSKSAFNFLETLFKSHLSTVLKKDSGTFSRVMTCIHEGLQSSDATLSSTCATTIDNLSTFYFVNIGKQKPEVQLLNDHLAQQPNLFSGLTSTLFNLLLFGPAGNHWAIMKPMLALMLCNEQSFTGYKDQLMSTQTADNQLKLNDAFTKLLSDVNRNLESTNRDRFTQKLTAFRVAARGFLTL